MSNPVEQVKKAMKAKNLSARALARNTGLSTRAVQDFLHQVRPTRVSTRNLIYQHLGLEVDKEGEAQQTA